MRSLLFAAAAVLASGPGCTTPSPGPDAAPPFDGSIPVDAGVVDGLCADACARLRVLGCQEGAPACEGTCTHVRATGLTELHPECLAAAATKADARRCGSVTCP